MDGRLLKKQKKKFRATCFDTRQQSASSPSKYHNLFGAEQIRFVLSGELWRSRLSHPSDWKCLDERRLLQINGAIMGPGGVLLLLLTLWATANATFYGDSITFATPKKSSNGTITVGFFFFYHILSNRAAARANQIRPRDRIELVPQFGYVWLYWWRKQDKQTKSRLKKK